MERPLTSCSCAGKNLDKLVKPAVLSLLAQGARHGYALLGELVETGLFDDGDAPDASGVYRILKELESQGFVTTEWDLASSGPARRIHTLTGAGRKCLKKWGETLENYQVRIQKIRNLIEAALQ